MPKDIFTFDRRGGRTLSSKDSYTQKYRAVFLQVDYLSIGDLFFGEKCKGQPFLYLLTFKKSFTMPKNNDLSAVAAVSASTNGEAINNNQVSEAKKPVAADEPLAVSNIKVSERTAKYIRLKAQLSDLWNALYDAIEEDYGVGVDKIIDEKFYPNLSSLDETIESYMLASISDAMGTMANKNTII